MKYSLRHTAPFKKVVNRGFSVAWFEKVVDTPADGDYAGSRECLVTSDWLLGYCAQEDVLVPVP